MKLRLFVAINLPESLKNLVGKVLHESEPLFDFPIRFSAAHNWHITLTFLGYQEERKVSVIMDGVKNAVKSFMPPELEISRLDFGPMDRSERSLRPRMIWLAAGAESSEKLTLIKRQLEDNLLTNGVAFRQESRLFTAHITLARFEARSVKELPNIRRDFSYIFYPKSLDLMESQLKRSGAEYSVLASFDFKK